jgi:hypothetical protein
MNRVRAERLTVRQEEPFVVFLIGARINKWWLLPVAWAVGAAMGRMMKELESNRELGLVASEQFFGRTLILVQYWKSTEHLYRYARSKDHEHVPAWKVWAQRLGMSGAVGIWHETYVIEPGAYECVYHHMPAFGLGRVGELVPAEGPLKTAAGRLGHFGKKEVAA